MERKPSPNVALITGCSDPKSLGYAIALECRRRNWTTFAAGRNTDRAAKGLIRAGCKVIHLDVVSEDSIRSAVDSVKEHGHGLQLLVNNAAASGIGPLLETSPESMSILLDTNIVGPLRLVQAFTPLLLQSSGAESRAKTKSAVINVGGGPVGIAWQGAYHVSKGGLMMLSDVLRQEMTPLGIDVLTYQLAALKTGVIHHMRSFDLRGNDPSLPKSNFESEIWPEVEKIQLKARLAGADPSEIARSMLDSVEAPSRPRKVYLGPQSWIYKFIWPLIPFSLLDRLLIKGMQTFRYRILGYGEA